MPPPASPIPPVSQWRFYRFDVAFAGKTRRVDVLAPNAEIARLGVGASEDERVSLAKINATDLAFASKTTSRTAKPQEVGLFFKEMGRAARAHIGALTALELLAPSAKTPYFRGVIGSIQYLVSQKGVRVSQCLGFFPGAFTDGQQAMAQAGEESGAEERTYSRLAAQAVSAEKLVGAFKRALMGPAITLGMTALACVFMHFVVIPKFQASYKAIGGDLPFATRLVFSLSDLFREHPTLLLVPVAVCWMLFSLRNDILKNHGVQRTALKVPIVGPLWGQIMLARSLRTMALMYEAAVPAKKTFALVSRTAGHIQYSQYFENIGKRLASGEDIYSAFAAERERIGPDGRQIAGRLRMAAKTGEIPAALSDICDILEEEASLKTEALPQLANPVVMTIAGAVIGTIAMAITAPNFIMLTKALKGQKVF